MREHEVEVVGALRTRTKRGVGNLLQVPGAEAEAEEQGQEEEEQSQEEEESGSSSSESEGGEEIACPAADAADDKAAEAANAALGY